MDPSHILLTAAAAPDSLGFPDSSRDVNLPSHECPFMDCKSRGHQAIGMGMEDFTFYFIQICRVLIFLMVSIHDFILKYSLKKS